MSRYKPSGTGVWDNERKIWFDDGHYELWQEYQAWLAIEGNTPDPADPEPLPPPRFITKRTIANRLKARGKYVDAFNVVTAAGALQDWNDAQDIQADPPDAQVVQLLTAAGLSETEINKLLEA